MGIPRKARLETDQNMVVSSRNVRFSSLILPPTESSNQRTAELIRSIPSVRVTFVLDEGGIHNEKDWRKRFPGMLGILKL